MASCEKAFADHGYDELSDLARASNRMAAKLKDSYTSVKHLQREITGRKRGKKSKKSDCSKTSHEITEMSRFIW